MSVFTISTTPEQYGSNVTENDVTRCAEIIMEKAAAEYPDVAFKVGDGRHDMDEDKAGEIQQYINDNWADWV